MSLVCTDWVYNAMRANGIATRVEQYFEKEHALLAADSPEDVTSVGINMARTLNLSRPKEFRNDLHFHNALGAYASTEEVFRSSWRSGGKRHCVLGHSDGFIIEQVKTGGSRYAVLKDFSRKARGSRRDTLLFFAAALLYARNHESREELCAAINISLEPRGISLESKEGWSQNLIPVTEYNRNLGILVSEGDGRA